MEITRNSTKTHTSSAAHAVTTSNPFGALVPNTFITPNGGDTNIPTASQDGVPPHASKDLFLDQPPTNALWSEQVPDDNETQEQEPMHSATPPITQVQVEKIFPTTTSTKERSKRIKKAILSPPPHKTHANNLAPSNIPPHDRDNIICVVMYHGLNLRVVMDTMKNYGACWMGKTCGKAKLYSIEHNKCEACIHDLADKGILALKATQWCHTFANQNFQQNAHSSCLD